MPDYRVSNIHVHLANQKLAQTDFKSAVQNSNVGLSNSKRSKRIK